MGEDSPAAHPMLVGASETWARIRSKIEPLARSALPVLIVGETGVGKEHLARALHQAGGRQPSSFRVVDCRASAAASAVSELSGCKPCLHPSDHPTTVFKNIEALPKSAQAELAALINQHILSTSPRQRPRIISTTTCSLQDFREHQNISADLSFCVATVVVAIPPLRERIEDVEPLASHFAAMALSIAGSTYFVDTMLPNLLARQWPGNVRELRNAVFCMADGLHDLSGDEPSPGRSLSDHISLFEKLVLVGQLRLHTGNIAKVCQSLSVSKTSLYDRLHRYSIDPEPFKKSKLRMIERR